jgi:hypothetical protein
MILEYVLTKWSLIILSGLDWLEVDFMAKKKLRGFSPPENYTDRATAACRRS